MRLHDYAAACGMALDSIKALSVRQPFATLIINGDKTIEGRSRPIIYRGPLVICASKSKAYLSEDDADFPRGVAVGVVEIVGCRPMKERDLYAACCEGFTGNVTGFAWLLVNPRRCIAAVPVKGVVSPWPWIKRGAIDFPLA